MSDALTPSQRANGQRAAARSNLLSQGVAYVMTGAVMMLYASDVLGLSVSRISQVLAVIPLAALGRMFFLPGLRRLGYVRTLLITDAVRLATVIVLLVLPSRAITFPLYLVVLLILATAGQLGGGTVWQPLMRDITTVADRGRFFARMRFQFTVVGTLVTAAVPLLVGSRITEAQYKLLLLIPLVALVNHIYWLRGIPELPHGDPGQSKYTFGEMIRSVREAPLLRRPLVIFAAVQFSLFPLLPLYLRQVVGMPSNIVSTYLFCVSLGSALSYALFGRIADSMGFKPLLRGVLVIASIASPLYLLVTPLQAGFNGLAEAALPDRLSVASLFVLGLVTGSVSAGAGLGLTSIQHYFVSGKDSLVAMNAFSSITVVMVSIQSLLLGLLVDYVAIPIGNIPIVADFLAADVVKVYLVVAATLFRVAALVAAAGLPNLRAYFGLADFFSALSPTSIRSMVIGRRTSVEDETARLLAARRMGLEPTPLGVDPLLDMLEDPSYDVKVEAIRALGRTSSTIAGDRLLAELRRDDMGVPADHISWSLGELKFAPAVDLLIERVTDRGLGPRMRASAARALGKIGDVRAEAPLFEVVAEQPPEAIRASAMIALVLLGTRDGLASVLVALATLRGALTERELLFHLRRRLALPTNWLLLLPKGTGARAALLGYVEGRSLQWQSERSAIVAAVRNRDPQRVRELAHQALQLNAAAGLRALSDADSLLLSAASEIESWTPLAKLTALWLLERSPAKTAR